MSYKGKHYLTDLTNTPVSRSATLTVDERVQIAEHNAAHAIGENERLQKDCIRLSTELREAQTKIAEQAKEIERLLDQLMELTGNKSQCDDTIMKQQAEIERLRDDVRIYTGLHKAILNLEGSEGMTDRKFVQWTLAALKHTEGE